VENYKDEKPAQPDLKKKSDRLFKDLGTDTTSAIRIFLTQAVAYNGFPFEIKRNPADVSPYTALSEDEMPERLDKAGEILKESLI